MAGAQDGRHQGNDIINDLYQVRAMYPLYPFPPTNRIDMINPTWQREKNIYGGNAAIIEMLVNEADGPLPFSNNDLQDVLTQALYENKHNTKHMPITNSQILKNTAPQVTQAHINHRRAKAASEAPILVNNKSTHDIHYPQYSKIFPNNSGYNAAHLAGYTQNYSTNDMTKRNPSELMWSIHQGRKKEIAASLNLPNQPPPEAQETLRRIADTNFTQALNTNDARGERLVLGKSFDINSMSGTGNMNYDRGLRRAEHLSGLDPTLYDVAMNMATEHYEEDAPYNYLREQRLHQEGQYEDGDGPPLGANAYYNGNGTAATVRNYTDYATNDNTEADEMGMESSERNTAAASIGNVTNTQLTHQTNVNADPTSHADSNQHLETQFSETKRYHTPYRTMMAEEGLTPFTMRTASQPSSAVASARESIVQQFGSKDKTFIKPKTYPGNSTQFKSWMKGTAEPAGEDYFSRHMAEVTTPAAGIQHIIHKQTEEAPVSSMSSSAPEHDKTITAVAELQQGMGGSIPYDVHASSQSSKPSKIPKRKVGEAVKAKRISPMKQAFLQQQRRTTKPPTRYSPSPIK